jgi:hypothetical protein
MIAPSLLIAQVKSTASWALTEGAPWTEALREDADPLKLLLAAHFTTVATFCPTDIDSQIRHHQWQCFESLEEPLDRVDEVASWDPRAVSARVVDGTSGHDGEWFSVRAGALGRALTLGREVDRVRDAIETELAREEQIFQRAIQGGDPKTILCVATILAHNLGDLSRVVEAWPKATPDPEGLRARYVRLGHEGGRFALAGIVNKAFMAVENDRFLALREARVLRRDRSLLLPIGPFFDDWGRTVATTPLLEDEERAAVVGALVDTHVRRPDQAGCLRALAGIHQGFRGGLDALADDVPARLRKLLRGGPIREHVGIDARRFEQRFFHRLDAVLAEQGVKRGK